MKVSSGLFRYASAERTLSAFISDLGRFHFEQVYKDSCDEGLTVVSDKTGREVDYAVTREQRDSEGDLQLWELRPTRESVRSYPAAAQTKIILFND